MSSTDLYPRYARARLEEALEDTPVVLIHGPRQSGKTTLARQVGDARGYAYLSFDDEVQFASASADPVRFVADLPRKVVLDEVQRVPGLFRALKLAVDRDRSAGRFILTGSANVLLLPRLSDSLAGRMGILRLHPLAQCEIESAEPHFLEALLAGAFKIRSVERLGPELVQRVVAGGYPAALARATERRRRTWYLDYVETLVQRDVRELARISSLDALPRLLQLAAGSTGQLLNASALASPFHLSRPTIRDYLTLLERVFLIETVPPWHVNRLSRLVKTPKLHVGDSGLAAALLGHGAKSLQSERAVFGHLLETFVFQELRKQAGWSSEGPAFFHFRDRDGSEVDLVLEFGSHAVVGIEVKAGATVTAGEFGGLKKLKAAAGKRFRAGVMLYDGESSVPFGEGLFAVPIRALWEDA